MTYFRALITSAEFKLRLLRLRRLKALDEMTGERMWGLDARRDNGVWMLISTVRASDFRRDS